MTTKIVHPRKAVSPLDAPITIKVINRENMHGVLHWTRSIIYGECPACGSTHNAQVKGWNKIQCKNCGNTWLY
jgi:NADH pyrophosphatase NudC (nudix superfamily)